MAISTRMMVDGEGSTAPTTTTTTTPTPTPAPTAPVSSVTDSQNAAAIAAAQAQAAAQAAAAAQAQAIANAQAAAAQKAIEDAKPAAAAQAAINAAFAAAAAQAAAKAQAEAAAQAAAIKTAADKAAADKALADAKAAADKAAADAKAQADAAATAAAAKTAAAQAAALKLATEQAATYQAFKAKEAADAAAAPTVTPTPVATPVTPTPAATTINTTTLAGVQAASVGATGTQSTATGATGATGSATGATGAVDTKPDPTKTAYADLTPEQRAAMTQTEKTDYIQAAREAAMAADAAARAATDPMKNFAVRPEAPAPANGMLNYYSWIGGVNTGEWKLYQAPDTPENQAKYGARSAGGTTAATASSAVGANTIVEAAPATLGTKTIVLTVDNPDGSKTVTYSDGTSAIIPKAGATGLTGAIGATGGATGATGATGDTGPTTNITYLKASLRSLGFTSSILDSSTSFLTSLLKEGLDYDNATEIFLNNKDYTLKNGTKIESPFYAEYGYLNEGLVTPKSANELFNAVEGYKEVVDKYGLSKKYLDKESLKQYTKNNVSAKDLAERANIATLKSNNQDPSYVEALQKLGYIATSADLKDFFMDSKIGQEQLNINRTTGAFAAEAVRRAQSGIQFNSERFKALAQTLVEKGMSETEASALAAQGFENIAAQLGTTTKLSGIYENQRVATMGQVQSELEKEQFSGLESERRKRLKELETRAFQGSSGITSSSLAKRNILGTI